MSDFSPTPLTSHSATFHVTPATGPVRLYEWAVHDDATAAPIWYQSSPYWEVILYQRNIGDEPFFLSAQVLGTTLSEFGKIGPYSDVYQFTTPLPEPSFLFVGLAALWFLRSQRCRR